MVTIVQTHRFADAFTAFGIIESINQYYPNIMDWYVNTVMPGVVTGSDILLQAKDDNYKTVGIALAKAGAESKLRCVRVIPEYAGTGLGIKLIDAALDRIGDKPVASVSEELFHDYSRMFIKRYGFSLTDVSKGAYRKGKLEYFFNQ